jgi:hypothetical protein
VVRLRLAGGAAHGRSQHTDGLVQPALVGQRAGRHDPALGHELGSGAGGTELVPQLLGLRVATEGAVRIGEDRVLVDAASQGAVGLELPGGLGPAAEAVKAQPVQLAE